MNGYCNTYDLSELSTHLLLDEKDGSIFTFGHLAREQLCSAPPISRSLDRCLAGHAPPLVPRGLPCILKDEKFMGF
jgi:hypothetical protein